MRENTHRITPLTVAIPTVLFLALMAWTAFSLSEGDSDLVTGLRFGQMAIYGSLAFASAWFGIRALHRGESQRPVSSRAIIVSVAVLVLVMVGMSAAALLWA